MTLQRLGFAFLAAAVFLLASQVPARAQNLVSSSSSWLDGFDEWLDEIGQGKREHWQFGIGAGLGTAPDYPGGDNYDTLALPVFQIKYKDQITLDPLGLRVRVWKKESWRLRLVMGLSESRKAQASSPVSLLPGTGRGLNGGFVLEGQIAGPVAFRLNARKEFAGGHAGTTVTPSLGVVLRDKKDTFSFIPEVALTWGNGRYMDAFFSVTPQGSAVSGLGIYDASAGFREAAARLTASYRFNEDWMVVTRFQASQLLKEAKRSSIVRQAGDSFQGLVGVGVMYTF
ncbi:MAG: MipA/OmpV family protein [Rhodospirillaceae bacterium]|nr:MipA/OmpV family protein [Rhodospirillaceae bacterium]